MGAPARQIRVCRPLDRGPRFESCPARSTGIRSEVARFSRYLSRRRTIRVVPLDERLVTLCATWRSLGARRRHTAPFALTDMVFP